MTLKSIVTNSKYITDENITDADLVSQTNGAISIINTEAGCNLPFVTTDNLTTTSYDALTDSWQLRLFEPFLSFSITSNDTNDTATSFNYNRFLSALDRFVKKGVTTITNEDYIGDSERYFEVDTTAIDAEIVGSEWWFNQ